MSEEVAGRVTLVVNGLPVVHATNFNAEVRNNRELVVGMKPTGTPFGFVEGAEEYSLSFELLIPLGIPEPNWLAIRDGIIMVTEQGVGGSSTVYTGCFTTREGKRYQEKGAAQRSIEMQATGRSFEPSIAEVLP